jgi:hypothetical protein
MSVKTWILALYLILNMYSLFILRIVRRTDADVKEIHAILCSQMEAGK